MSRYLKLGGFILFAECYLDTASSDTSEASEATCSQKNQRACLKDETSLLHLSTTLRAERRPTTPVSQPHFVEELLQYQNVTSKSDPHGSTGWNETIAVIDTSLLMRLETVLRQPTMTPRHSIFAHRRFQKTDFQSIASLEFAKIPYMDWILLGGALIVYSILYQYLIDWPTTQHYHGVALLIWLFAGGVYGSCVWRGDAEKGAYYLVGYLMEFIFSIENVFIYHTVVKYFQMPRSVTQRALVPLICCQLVFQLAIFSSLSGWLQSIETLPYFLGAWLVYLGLETLREGDHADYNRSEEVLEKADTAAYRLFHRLLGNRLLPYYQEASVFVRTEDGRLCVTMLGPALACLIAVDFVMEIDVTLCKIESIPYPLNAYASSMAASFALPEIFFVARDLFQRFSLLKYGVTFVLLFFGMQLLGHRVFSIPDLVGMVIIVVVMILCVLGSILLGSHHHSEPLCAHSRQHSDDIVNDSDSTLTDEVSASQGQMASGRSISNESLTGSAFSSSNKS